MYKTSDFASDLILELASKLVCGVSKPKCPKEGPSTPCVCTCASDRISGHKSMSSIFVLRQRRDQRERETAEGDSDLHRERSSEKGELAI